MGASFSRFKGLRFRVLSASFSRFWGLRFRSRVLRFQVLAASFSRFGCFVFEIWVLRASVFVFECFVFETSLNIRHAWPNKVSLQSITLCLMFFFAEFGGFGSVSGKIEIEIKINHEGEVNR